MTKTPTIDVLVEVMRRADDFHLFSESPPGLRWKTRTCKCGWKRGNESGWQEAWARHRREAVLAALLSATEDEECGECGGEGFIWVQFDQDEYRTMGSNARQCPVCHGAKSVPGKPLIIEAAVEAGIDVVGALVKLGVLASIGNVDVVEHYGNADGSFGGRHAEVEAYRAASPIQTEGA